MTRKSTPVFRAELVDAQTHCTVEELCLACGVDAKWLVELVKQGAVEPIDQVSAGSRFSSVAMVRVAKAKRLAQDLDLNPAGIAVVLELLDQIEILRSQLGKFQVSAD